MSRSYVLGNVLTPKVDRIQCNPGVDESDFSHEDEDGNPNFPLDGTVFISFLAEDGNGSVGVDIDLDLAERFWGTLGHVIQEIKHGRVQP